MRGVTALCAVNTATATASTVERRRGCPFRYGLGRVCTSGEKSRLRVAALVGSVGSATWRRHSRGLICGWGWRAPSSTPVAWSVLGGLVILVAPPAARVGS